MDPSVNPSRHRRIRNRILNILDRISFKFFHLRPSQRIVTVGILWSAFSLFLPWFSVGREFSGNAFSLSLGYVGYVRIFLLLAIAFVVFSHRMKSEVKSRSGFHVSDYAFCLFVAVVFLCFDVSSINVVRGFSVFTKDVSLGNGPALSIVASGFVALGGVFGYREHKRELYETTFVENSRTTAQMLEEYDAIIKKADPDRKNMSLPV